MSIVIFDLDGTLANIEHRLHFIKGDKKDWDGFFAACVGDKVNLPVATIWQSLENASHEMWIFSGRSDQVEEETRKWLLDNYFWPDKLLMRKEGDYQPDDELKESWFNGLTDIDRGGILCVFDDRKRIVDMWRKNGLTCLQVAEGNF